MKRLLKKIIVITTILLGFSNTQLFAALFGSGSGTANSNSQTNVFFSFTTPSSASPTITSVDFALETNSNLIPSQWDIYINGYFVASWESSNFVSSATIVNYTTSGLSIPVSPNTSYNLEFRSLSTNAAVISGSAAIYGDLATATLPTISTEGVSKTSTSATVYGSCSDNGGAALSSYGFNSSAGGGVATGGDATNWSRTLSGLSPNTQYTYQAYGTNSAGTSNGSTNSFYTYPSTPTLSASSSVTSSGLTASWSSVACNNYWVYVNSSIYTSTNSTSVGINGYGPNVLLSYYVTANGNGGPVATATNSTYTLANTPSSPSVATLSPSTLSVSINANSNPIATTFAIRVNGNQYVQANGSLGASPVWQTGSTWSVKTVTGLSAATAYSFDVIAKNGDGVVTAYGGTSSGRTRSLEPTSHSNTFTAAAHGPYQINVDFQDITTLSDGFGYIILRTTGAVAPTTTGIVDGMAPASLTLPVGTTLVGTITNSVTTYANPGLTDQTQYSYSIIPFNYDGTNVVTYNYKIDGLVPTASATTPPPYPAVQASDIGFARITRSSMNVYWTRGDGHKCLLMGREKYRIASEPLTDGVVYIANTDYDLAPSVSGAKVLSNGTDRYVTITGLSRYMLVYFKVCEYNEFTQDATYYLQEENASNPRARWTLRRDAMMEEDLTIDAEFAYPNPAKNSISTNFDLFEAGRVSAKLYDIEGREVIDLYNQELNFGYHTLTFDISKVQNGVYQLVISKGNEVIAYPISVVR